MTKSCDITLSAFMEETAQRATEPTGHLQTPSITESHRNNTTPLTALLSPPLSVWCYFEGVEWEETCRSCQESPFSGVCGLTKLTVDRCHFSAVHHTHSQHQGPHLQGGILLYSWEVFAAVIEGFFIIIILFFGVFNDILCFSWIFKNVH